MLRYITLFVFILNVYADTPPIEIKMIDATKLDGETFDSETYGKDIMFLFWESSNDHDRRFKTSRWDMLATEKDKWVRSHNVTIGEMDCSHNWLFCKRFIGFNVTGLSYPFIGLSYNNERFKKYNGTMDYPSLTNFLHGYFERNCALNENWCDEEEQELLYKWRNMTLQEQLRVHINMNYNTDQRVKQFEQWRSDLRQEFKKKLKELQEWTDRRDQLTSVLFHIIHQSPQIRIDEEMEYIKNNIKNEL